ncbi:MAG TPA: TonB-dependent receptor plug domain-containing protein, partial [Gammaproteobacteria bacterium]|nr:TonB-dependent receptor plug domain-containing protein [Gammaproteobacteria bacterium]
MTRQASLPVAAGVSAILFLFLCASPLAMAADAATAQAAPLPTIEVTGTRLSEPSLAAANPVVTITRAQIEASGFTQLGELINSLPFTGAGQNTHWNANGTGRVLADIHNLGSNRVLVLVNGQRWVTTNSGPVDLSTIPLEVVDHVEVLLDGASAIYGSDAISGVINIITVKNFVGAAAATQIGMYDAHGDGGGWDGKMYGAHFLLGTGNERSNVTLGAGYYNSNPVFAGNRDISRYPVAGFGNLLGSPITPDGHLILDTNDPGPFGSDCSAGGEGFAYHCDLAGPLDGDSAHPFTTADLYNDAADTYIQTPQERWYLYGQGHYDFTDNVEFVFMTTYERRNATELTPPGGWDIGSQGSIKVNGLPVGIAGSNPYNPFGMDLVPAAPGTPTFDAWCARWGSAADGGCTDDFGMLDYLGIRPLGQGSETITQNLDNYYFNGGFDGSFSAFGNPWTWNANYAYGQSLETEIRHGLTLAEPLQVGLGPADVCDGSPGCVPLDFFGGSAGVTPAMIGYTNFVAHFVSDFISRDYNANISGGFFNGWYAGPWQVAAGYEYLNENGEFEPDATVIKGLWTGFAIQPQYGRKNSNAQ